jgi:hypothetical protein
MPVRNCFKVMPVNRIVGPNETITAERVRDYAKVDVPRSVARIQEFLQHPCCEEAMRPGVAEAARLRGLTRRARKFPQLIFLCPTPAEANCVWHFYVDERFHVSAGSP